MGRLISFVGFKAFAVLAAWLIGWMIFIYMPIEADRYALVRTFVFNLWTFGCVWCWNHYTFHRLPAKWLPKAIAEGKRLHSLHHARPTDLHYILIPNQVWVHLYIASGISSFCLTLLQIGLIAGAGFPGWIPVFLLKWLFGWFGMLCFIYGYSFCHDYSHARPEWRIHWLYRWIYPASHIEIHHPRPMQAPGVFPIFEVLMPSVRIYFAIMIALKGIEEKMEVIPMGDAEEPD